MAYQLSWYKPDQVLSLKFLGELRIEELEEINDAVIKILDEQLTKVNILIDATDLSASHNAASQLRTTQKYMNHPSLDSALVVSENKLNRLITLMAFSISRAKFMQFNTMQHAESMIGWIC